MKTLRPILSPLLFASFLLPLSTLADTEVVDSIEWTYTVQNGKASVNGFRITFLCYGGAIIPSSLGGHPVTSIGNSAFAGNREFYSVTIPDGVTSIGDHAFSGSVLSTVTIPDSVTNIAESAFDGCENLTETKITVSDVLKFAANWATNSINANLRGTRLLFVNGEEISNIVIPEGVMRIGPSAFFGCSGLKSVTIPDSVQTIGNEAFFGCDTLVFDTTTILGVRLVDGWAVGTTTGFPTSLNLTGVRGIGDYAFNSCSGLISVTIPDNITNIGKSLFKDCDSLTTVIIPDSVTNIAESAFDGCSRLISVTIPDNITNIEKSSFKDCDSLTTVIIPASVTNIAESAFDGCNRLTSVLISADVTSIGNSAFSGCSDLVSVTIPDSVTSIGADTFSNCSSLQTLWIPRQITTPFTGLPPNCNVIYKDAVPRADDSSPYVKIHFMTNGGSLVSTIADDYGANVVPPADPERFGYTFTGWLPMLPATMPPSNTVCVAQWTPINYTVHFNANGGSGTMEDATYHIEDISGIPLPTTGGIIEIGEIIPSLSDLLYFTTGGDANWYSQTSDTHDGVDAMRSGTISDSQTSWIETKVEGQGTISFWCKVSSENNYDWLEFSIDGTQMSTICGTEGDWEYMTFDVSEDGEHSFRWIYRKDSSVSHGADCGWLDEVEWSGSFSSHSDNSGASLSNTVADYSFDGDLSDGSGNGHDLENHGGVFCNDRFGNENGALSFDGFEHCADSAGIRLEHSFSVACWFKTSVTKDSQGSASWSWDAGNALLFPVHGGDNAGIGLSVGTDGLAVTEHGSMYLPTIFNYDATIGTDWNHVCMVVENDTIVRLYLNGEMVASGTLSEKNKVFDVNVGGGIWGYYTGSVDDLIVINRALDSEEIMNLSSYTGGPLTGSELLPPCAFSKSGHSFLGWATETNGEVAYGDREPVSHVFDDGETTNVTLYAVWGVNQYTISFDSAEGSPVGSITQDYGSSITPPANPTRTGYSFTGWQPMLPATMPASNIVCVAQWTPVDYTVHFDANGGTGEVGDSIYHIEDMNQGVNGLEICYYDISSSGYYTWSLSEEALNNYFSNCTPTIVTNTLDFGESLDSGIAGVDQSSVYQFSDWGMNDLRFEAYGTTNRFHGKYALQSQEFIAAHLTGFIDISEAGTYDFACIADDYEAVFIDGVRVCCSQWDSIGNGSVELAAGRHSFSMGFYEGEGGHGFAVQWKKPGDTSWSPLPQSVLGLSESVSATLSPCSFSKSGHTFLGWATVPNGEIVYADREPIRHVFDDGETTNVTLYAVWDVNQYTISFDPAEGSPVGSITQDYGTSITPPANPTRTGYSFVGWLPELPATMPASNTVYVAQWELLTLSLDVASAFGTALPDVGRNLVSWGDRITASVADSAAYGFRQHCTGWTGTGSVPASGTGTSTTFTIQEDSSITWNWERQTWHSCTIAGDAAHRTTSGWKTFNGADNVVYFSPNARPYRYDLSGDTQGVTVDVAAERIILPTDRPRSVVLTVHAYTKDEVIEDGGTPLAWIPTPYGTIGWSIVEDASAADGFSLRSGAAGSGATSAVEATVSGAGTLSFDWRISSARGHFARFYVDGVQQKSITRTMDWSTVTATLGDGPHTLRWAYEKGTGETGGEDAAFLDNVVWSPITLDDALDTDAVVWTTDGAQPWFPEISVSADGTDAARSGAVTGLDVSALTATVLGAGTLSWSWMGEIAGNAGVDVFLDGEWCDSVWLEGDTDWETASLAIAGAGTHTVRFEFWNGGTADTLSDYAVIDQVSWSGTEARTLAVASAFGTASPAVGTHVLARGGQVAASVAAPAAANGTRRVCTGWTGTGSVPASGSAASVAFALNEDSSIEWNWRTDYWTEITVSGGTCAFAPQWVAAGTQIEVAITASAHVPTVTLSGDTAGATLDGTTLRFAADRPRTIHVSIEGETPADLEIPDLSGPGGLSFGTDGSGNPTFNVRVTNPVPGVYYTAFVADTLDSPFLADAASRLAEPSDATITFALAAGDDRPSRFVRIVASTAPFAAGDALPEGAGR